MQITSSTFLLFYQMLLECSSTKHKENRKQVDALHCKTCILWDRHLSVRQILHIILHI